MEHLVSRKIDFVLKQNGNHIGVFESQMIALAAMDKLDKAGWKGVELFARTTDTVQDLLKIG